MFWVRSDLDSGKKIRVFNWGGGVLGKVNFGICVTFIERFVHLPQVS